MRNSINVLKLQDTKDKYQRFIKTNESLLYSSVEYLDLISNFLKEECKLLCVFDSNEEILGAIPFFEKEGAYGKVLNSLPFYGSNGGYIATDSIIKEQLLTAFENYVHSNDIVSATIINNPLVDVKGYELTNNYIDKRIGQFTFFDEIDKSNLDESLFSRFHSKTRNMVRKALKSNMKVILDNNQLDYIFDIHKENMNTIGGIFKPHSFFKQIESTLCQGRDYNVFIASLDGRPIAGLLLLYHKKSVEYFTPVIDVNYRSYQPMSLLIFESMKVAIKEGYEYWNWGGTWESQENVYRFKSRWGAIDKPYYYYTFLRDQNMLQLSKQDLLNEYPYFFVLPFKELKNERF